MTFIFALNCFFQGRVTTFGIKNDFWNDPLHSLPMLQMLRCSFLIFLYRVHKTSLDFNYVKPCLDFLKFKLQLLTL